MDSRACAIALSGGMAACAMGQMAELRLGAAGIVHGMFADEAGEVEIGPAGPVAASLSYDGSSTWGFAGQDFESVFDVYDVYLIEPFRIDGDARLGEFRSAAFGTDNPFGATDVIIEVYLASDLGDMCNDSRLPAWVMRSIPGAGFFDGTHAVSDLGGQCLAAGSYLLRWAVELEFNCCGQVFFFAQAGPHDNGGGEPDDGLWNNLGDPFGMGICGNVFDQSTGLQTGVNFVLFGEIGDCAVCSQDPNACGDWDGDADADADDFFAYLDSFAAGDECADVDGNGSIDADDFFGYLNRFVAPC